MTAFVHFVPKITSFVGPRRRMGICGVIKLTSMFVRTAAPTRGYHGIANLSIAPFVTTSCPAKTCGNFQLMTRRRIAVLIKSEMNVLRESDSDCAERLWWCSYIDSFVMTVLRTTLRIAMKTAIPTVIVCPTTTLVKSGPHRSFSRSYSALKSPRVAGRGSFLSSCMQ